MVLNATKKAQACWRELPLARYTFISSEAMSRLQINHTPRRYF